MNLSAVFYKCITNMFQFFVECYLGFGALFLSGLKDMLQILPHKQPLLTVHTLFLVFSSHLSYLLAHCDRIRPYHLEIKLRKFAML